MARGQVRNPVTVLLLTLVTCGLYGLYWFTQIAGELNDALGEERFKPVTDIVLSIVTCGLWFLWLEWRLANAVLYRPGINRR